jgi:anti-anti-sigma factor
MQFEVEIDNTRPDLIEVVLAGGLNTETASKLETILEDVFSKPVRAVRFEMSRLSYISSIGIKLLFHAFKTLRDQNTLFLMVNLQPQIMKVLDIAKALPAENIFASVQEADEYFDAMQRKALGGTDDNN